MAFNISTNKVATKRLIKVVESRVLGRLTTEEVVDKTLDGFGRVNIVSEDKVGEMMQFSGIVTIDALFSAGDKTVQSSQTSMEFNERVSLGNVDAVALIPTVKEVKLTKETEDQLQVLAVVETKIYAIVEDELGCLVGETEGYYTMKKQVQVNKLVASANTSFTKTIELDGDYHVLFSMAKTIVSKITPFENYCLIDGYCAVDFLVRDGEQIKKISKQIDLTEEIAVLNLSSESALDFNVFDKSVTLSPLSEKNGFVVDVLIGVCVWGYEFINVDVITDCFSDKSVLDLTYSNFTTYDVKEPKFFSERKNLVVDVENKKRMDEIIYIGIAESRVETLKPENGNLIVLGQTMIPVVYKNYDSDEILSTELFDEFELSLPVDLMGIDYSADIHVSTMVNSFKNKAGKDISLLVDYDGVIVHSISKTEQSIVQIEEAEALQGNKDSIIVYKPEKGETVFDIAKNLHIAPDVVLSQNPQIEDGNIISQVVVYKLNR